MPGKTTTERVRGRIRRLARGAVFTAKDFTDLGSRGLVDVTLSRLAFAGTIRRLSRGLYDYPKDSRLLQCVLSPDMDAVARALARRFNWTITPAGAEAANRLHLSTQVPAKTVYVSNGPSRTYRIAGQTIRFRHVRPSNLAGGDQPTQLILRAMKYMGRDGLLPRQLEDLRRALPPAARRRLTREARKTADWIHELVRDLGPAPGRTHNE